MSKKTFIDPTARLVGDVEIGEGATLGPGCIVNGPARIGAEVEISAHAVIGATPFDTRRCDTRASKGVRIGAGSYVAEFTSVKSGTRGPTRIGTGCRIGSHVSIGHDCIIEDGAVLLPGVILAGHVRVMASALIGVGVILRQRCVIGPYSTVAMGAIVTRSIPPLAMHVPGRELRQNAYNLPEEHSLRGVINEGPHGTLDTSHPEVAVLMATYASAVADAARVT